jgi:hypothetical protein
MGEQCSREAPENQLPPQSTDEAKREERTRPPDEFRSYSLDLLVVLEA